MTIEELKSTSIGTSARVIGVIADKRLAFKKDGNPFLSMTIQDATTSITIPLWSDVVAVNERYNIGDIICLDGRVTLYKQNIQLINVTTQLIDKNDVNLNDYVPSYVITDEQYRSFIELVEGLEDRYKLFAKRAVGLDEPESDMWRKFISAVAAANMHGNRRGGLFLHTLFVMRNVDAIVSNYNNGLFYYDIRGVVNRDRLILKAILHDIMKTEEYQYDTIIKRKSILVDHTLLGASYVRQVNKELSNILSEEEIDDVAYAVICHHGHWGKFEMKTVEDYVLHIADLADSQIVNAVEKKI